MEIIAEKKDFTEIFYSGCKNEQTVGLEYEKLAVYKNNFEAVKYEDIVKILLEMENDDRTVVFENKYPMGMVLPQGHISLEPGSQFEISLNPVKNISEIEKMIEDYNGETAEIAEEFGIYWLGAGIQPVSVYENIKIIPKKRYAQMTNYLPKKARLPFVMMRETAGIQAGFDYESEEDAMSKLSTAIKLSPIVSAMFANSPVRNSRLNGSKSFRAYSWLNTDEDRCGLISEKILHNDFSFEDYRKVLFDIPMIFIEKNDKYIPTGDMTFGEYYRKGFEGYFPTKEDWNTHLSLFFPDVRLKSYLEIRNHDSQKTEMITAVPALWKALLYNKDAQNAVEDIFKGCEFKDFEELRYLTPEYALDVPFKRYPLYDLAKEILSIAMQSLLMMKTGEEQFLLPLAEYVKNNKTPADEIIEMLKGKEKITTDDLSVLVNK
ncbi:MAG: hypothetical protein K6C94_03195 [Candidatus Gastranaerophilales bacterium]|nr:hypothetical protein [Candidatus Gastranaerophilales bacterium]